LALQKPRSAGNVVSHAGLHRRSDETQRQVSAGGVGHPA
jgi:hypothetical protein